MNQIFIFLFMGKLFLRIICVSLKQTPFVLELGEEYSFRDKRRTKWKSSLHLLSRFIFLH